MNKMEIQSITGMSLSELEALCSSIGVPSYRAKQILSWIYKKRVTAFDEMSNLPRNFHKQLEEKYQVFQTKVDSIVQITDSTEKFLIHLSDENVIECVLLREGRKITACA